MKTVKVVAAVIKEVNDKGSLLYSQRSAGMENSRMAGNSRRKIEAGETPQEALNERLWKN